jgi:mRNA-degrading endonuclease toxin of MazEF toxin-antitoxin module
MEPGSKALTELTRGDIVLVAFAHVTDDGQTQIKRRPCVIVSNNEPTGSIGELLVVPIIGTGSSNDGFQSMRVKVLAQSPQGESAGLRADSLVDCTVVAAIPQALIVSRIGRFPEEVMAKIDECIDRSSGPR